jgi:thymidylate synthase (FAD)
MFYKSELKIPDRNTEKFISTLIDSGHEEMLETFIFTVKFTCDRGVFYEIIRHFRTSYEKKTCRGLYGTLVEGCTFIEPCFWPNNRGDTIASAGNVGLDIWKETCSRAESVYLDLLERGAKLQEARVVLPNSIKTEVVTTENLREWRHFFKLHTKHTAHPQMQEIARPLLDKLKKRIPVIFDDIRYLQY